MTYMSYSPPHHDAASFAPSPISRYRTATSVELPPESTCRQTERSIPQLSNNTNNRLIVKLGGAQGYTRQPSYIEAAIQVFSASYSTYQHASIDVVWDPALQDPMGHKANEDLCHLFDALSSAVDKSPTHFRGRRSLATLKSMTLSIPNDVHPSVSYNTIDLSAASSLQELYWAGQHRVLLQCFRNIPFHQLTDISLTRCAISGGDAWAILSHCLNVIRVRIDYISGTSPPHLSNHALPPPGTYQTFPNLRSLMITSTTKLIPFLSLIKIPGVYTVRLFSKPIGCLETAATPLLYRRWEDVDSPCYLPGHGRLVVLEQPSYNHERGDH